MPDDLFFPCNPSNDGEAYSSAFSTALYAPVYMNNVPCADGPSLQTRGDDSLPELPVIAPLSPPPDSSPLPLFEVRRPVSPFPQAMVDSYSRGLKRVERGEEWAASTSSGVAKSQRTRSGKQVVSDVRNDASVVSRQLLDLTDDADVMPLPSVNRAFSQLGIPASVLSLFSEERRPVMLFPHPIPQTPMIHVMDTEYSWPPQPAPSALIENPGGDDDLEADLKPFKLLGYSAQAIKKLASPSFGLDYLEAIWKHHRMLTGFGFKPDEIARVVSCKGGPDFLQAMAENCEFLMKNRFQRSDILRIVCHPDGIHKLDLVREFLGRVPLTTLTGSDITDIVVSKPMENILQALENQEKWYLEEVRKDAVQDAIHPVQVPASKDSPITCEDILSLSQLPVAAVSALPHRSADAAPSSPLSGGRSRFFRHQYPVSGQGEQESPAQDYLASLPGDQWFIFP
ncbi:hypothetical protein [Legionella sp. CNM-4043-24]|uniref:hypothetical protein n=1 Tax=Legionella sp. CNM-4043-24 TaxID=3421646 RepID=UPI00403A92F0